MRIKGRNIRVKSYTGKTIANIIAICRKVFSVSYYFMELQGNTVTVINNINYKINNINNNIDIFNFWIYIIIK